MTYALWVPHGEVEAHLRAGWLVTLPRQLVSHDAYAVLMVWICGCPMRRVRPGRCRP
jgi:hypothetical protein